MPERHEDPSVFEPHTLRQLVESIDARLRRAPRVADLAGRVGLAPEDFVRTFRETTGLSLYRFVNRRRIRAALDLLRNPSRDLAGIARALGVSSPSRFSRLFSGLTGMTPEEYREQFGRTE